jgi:BirA family biotin operon repressor/biotin-[acetyl-CoA-carboxylase] ligase
VSGAGAGAGARGEPVPVYLALGSNLGDREALLARARRLLDGPDLRIVAASAVYETAPWGVTDQPPFLNQVLQGATALPPLRLLGRCRDVEAQLGRVRTRRFGPRSIDVDILLYDEIELSTPELTLPHPRLCDRAFVLVPLADLAPALRVPGPAGGGRTVRALLEALPARDGVALHAPERPLDAPALIGADVRRCGAVGSTNDTALRLLEAGAAEGTVIVAETQTAGRGRGTRIWVSPPGGLWLSVILRPKLPARHLPLVTFAAGIAAAGAIREATGLQARLKWPNDVLVGGAKVGGVLAEAAASGAGLVVGIGLNANVSPDRLPAGPASPAASLLGLLGRPVDREALLAALLRRFDREYRTLQTDGPPAVLVRWRAAAETVGRTVRVEMGDGTAVAGTAEDVDETGALRLRLADGTVRTVTAGDVHLRDGRGGEGAGGAPGAPGGPGGPG